MINYFENIVFEWSRSWWERQLLYVPSDIACSGGSVEYLSEQLEMSTDDIDRYIEEYNLENFITKS